MDVLRGRSSEGPGLRRSVEETTGANGVHLESGPASVLHLPRGPAALHAPAGAGRAPLHIPQGGLWAGKKKKKPWFPKHYSGFISLLCRVRILENFSYQSTESMYCKNNLPAQ